MSVEPGTRLGSYEVTAKLGEGGMGEVYRATDTRLKRDVAIKVLPVAFTEDKERLARFEREAQLLAQLHHPNIASIFGLEEANGTRALIMELVDGPTLAERLEKGSLPLTESLALARQIAEALEEAHEKGIVHRDLKPQNIKASIEGKIKVLDFGLAKAMDPAGTASGDPGSASQLAHSPTLTIGATVQGMILGTAAYMAPEQAKGLPTDKRADIWAFGVVLYEMLIGGSLFAGDTVGDTLAAVIRAEIDLDRLPRDTPAALRQLLRRCLERNPKNRLHDIADARIVLDDLIAGRIEEVAPVATPTASAVPPKSSRARWVLLGAAAAVALAAGIAIGRGGTGVGASTAAPFHAELEIAVPPKSSFASGLALSRDGRQVAIVVRDERGRTRIVVRSIESGETKEVPGSTDALYPFWAPDGRRIGFFAQSKLKVTDLLGSSPTNLADTAATPDSRGGTWNADDRIVYAPSFLGPLYSVSATGGEPQPATEIPAGSDIGTHRFPSFLPDGKRFVFFASGGAGIEPGEIRLGRLGDVATKRLASSNTTAVFAAPGYLLYVRGSALVAHRFDLEKEELVGEPIPLGINLPGNVNVSGQRSLASSANGVLVYREDKRSASRLIWADRKGDELGIVAAEADVWYYAPRLSPDGKRFAVGHYEAMSKSGKIWVHDLEHRLSTQATFDDKSDDQVSVWSPDGRELVYSSAGAQPSGIYRVNAGAPGSNRLAVPGDDFLVPSVWRANGNELVYSAFGQNGKGVLWSCSVEPDAKPRRLSPERTYEWAADLSPDGRWLAFQSDVSRRSEIYLRRMDDAAGATTVRISTDGGVTPRWRSDGKELLYLDEAGRIVSVPIRSLDPLQLGAPEPLFDARLEPGADSQFDVTADGQRLLLNRTLGTEQAPISVVIGWQERMRAAQPR